MSSNHENCRVLYLPNGDKFAKGKGNFGSLFKKEGKIFDGEFLEGKLNGWGTKRVLEDRRDSNSFYANKYIGTFSRGCKDGEGQMYYDNGDVYDGNWKRNKRCGQGIMWFNDGKVYLGEWLDDKFNGHGVLVHANGNRFEGCFKDDLKHGEGIYYHNDCKRVQKGIWINDICKCSLMQDIEYQSQLNTPNPIPELQLQNPEIVVSENFELVLNCAKKN